MSSLYDFTSSLVPIDLNLVRVLLSISKDRVINMSFTTCFYMFIIQVCDVTLNVHNNKTF